MTHDEIDALADAFVAAVAAGDLSTAERLYAPDAVIWHNYDRVEQSVTQNLAVLAWIDRHSSDRSYDDIRRIVVDDGFVQQHVLRGTTPAGPLAIEAMLRVWVADGQITRLEEYLDPAQASVLGG